MAFSSSSQIILKPTTVLFPGSLRLCKPKKRTWRPLLQTIAQKVHSFKDCYIKYFNYTFICVFVLFVFCAFYEGNLQRHDLIEVKKNIQGWETGFGGEDAKLGEESFESLRK